MASVPLTWTFKTEGGESVKQTLDQLSNAFDKAKASGTAFGKEQRNVKTAVRDTLGQQRLQNQLYMAQHPNLLRVSRGISTVTSITRTLLTISNALNLSKLQSGQVDARLLEDMKIESALKRELANELSKPNPDMEKVAEIQQRLNVAQAETIKNQKEIVDQKWDSMLTSVETAIFGIGTIFSNLINNKTIMKALSNAGSLFGGVFSGFFTFASSAINKITTWLFPPTVVSKAAIVSGGAGTITGTAFGIAFQVAAIAGLVIALVAIFDFIIEQITGWSFVKEIQKAFGIKDAKSVGGMVGYQSPAAVPWIGVNDYDNYIKDAGMGGNKNKVVLPSSIGNSVGLGAATISAQQALSNRTGVTTYDVKGNVSTVPSKKATGFEGMVNTPQLMMVGEAGPEYVSVTPHGGTRNGGGATIIVNIAGSVVTEKQLFSRLDDIQKNNLKRRGFTGT